MTMRVVVMGAGVVGVASAWYLAAAGHEVEVLDRQNAPGMETSFANGGQISVCHAEPWANPAAPGKVLRWLGHEASPLLWRLRADPLQWAWGLRFLRECLPGRTRDNIRGLIALGLSSRAALQNLRAELDLAYHQCTRGILHIYTSERELANAIPQAELMTSLGCTRLIKSPAECQALEPALGDSRISLVGGTYTPDDESGDAHLFTRQLAAKCIEQGVRFRFGTPIRGFEMAAGAISAVRLENDERVVADRYVIAAGSYSTPMLRQIGISIPVYPAKGYSITLDLPEEVRAPRVSLTDDEYKIVFSRLGGQLRVAGTAEFTGYDLTLNPIRIQALARRARQLFPDLEGIAELSPWTGLRPSTPGNLPLIGASRYANLFLNTGHGTLGWTLACGAGQLLADLMSGRPTQVAPGPYRP